MIGEYGEGNKSEGIILAGHMDTVFKDGFNMETDLIDNGITIDRKGRMACTMEKIKQDLNRIVQSNTIAGAVS